MQRLQTIAAKVNFEIKDMIVDQCTKLGMNESQFLNYYLEKAVRQEKELNGSQREAKQLQELLNQEKAVTVRIKTIESNKSTKRREVEQALENNDTILSTLHQQHGEKPIVLKVFQEAGFKFSYFTQYETIQGQKASIYWLYNYGFKNLGNNEFLINKR